MKKTYVSPEFEVIDMMVDGDILTGSDVDTLGINEDTKVGTNALSSHRQFPWSEEEE